MKPVIIIAMTVIFLFVPISAYAEETPSWFKSNAHWFSDEIISDSEYTDALTYLIHEGAIVIESELSPKTEQKIPDWVRNIFIWYGQEQISEDDVLNAIIFLVQNQIIQIDMSMMDTKSNLPLSELQQEKSNLENGFDLCTSDWYITGYFLPIESDYSGELVEVSVNEVKQFYLADFLENVKIEGWGRTNAGNYLGWYHGAYTISDRYLDAYDNDLIVGMVAVDDSVIEHGSELTIPTLPKPWNNMVFSGSDEGPSIIGKHIDVFTGEGINAENETFRITGSNNTVCMQN